MNNSFNVRSLPEYLALDQDHLRRARERQCRAWRREKLDIPLLMINDKITEKQKNIPPYDLLQIFTSPEKMLCSEAIGACSTANGRSDSVPSIRANLGAGIVLACLGLEQEAFPDKMPWLHQHMNKQQIAALSVDDIKPRGSFSRGLEMIHYFKEIMGDSLPVFAMDTQGPFDLAHLLIGDDLFLELYDDPEFVHHLLTICLEMGIRTHKWIKEAIGEPLTSLHHTNMMYSDSFGIRICEDTTALLSDDQIREFALPYSKRLAHEFGNAWVHYCGQNAALTNAILEAPEFKALNFGLIPGHEQEINFYAMMDKFAHYGKVNFNRWPMLPQESAEEYLVRLHKFSGQCVLAPFIDITPELEMAGLGSAEAVLDFWRKI